MGRGLVLVVGVGLAALALSGCLGERIEATDGDDATYPPGHGGHHDTPTPAAEELGAPDVLLEAHAGMPGDDLQLHPDPLRVPLGSVVEIQVGNAGRSAHTFTLHDYGLDTGMMAPGEEKALKFRADKPGTFEIMCDAPGHYQAGMKATLEVAA